MAQSHLSEAERVLERVPETAQEFAGFATNPAPLLAASGVRKGSVKRVLFFIKKLLRRCSFLSKKWTGKADPTKIFFDGFFLTLVF